MQFCLTGLSLAISIGSFDGQSRALEQMALIKRDSGDFSEAIEDALKSQGAAKIAGNLYIEASALLVEAACRQYFGSYSYCLSLLDRAMHLLELCNMSGGTKHDDIRNAQAEVYRCKSEYVEAHNIQSHQLHDSSAEQNPWAHAMTLLNIAQIDVEIGSTEDDVQQRIIIAGMLFRKINYSMGIIYCDMFRAALDFQLGNFLAARSLFQKCLTSTWGKDPDAVIYCLEKLASVQQWSAEDQISSSWPVILLVHSVKSKQRLELHKALQFVGDVFQSQGDPETATSLFTLALDGFTQMDVHRSRAECMVRLGAISNLDGDGLKAATLWGAARPLFERSSQGKQLAELDAKLAGLSHNQAPEVQQEILDRLSDIHAPTEHLAQLSGTESPSSTEIKEIGNMGLDDGKAAVVVDS
jgi:tetratricopeptide (TPR) repeat protein